MPTSIIAGSTGLVGSNILRRLSDNDHSVIALARKSIPDLPSNTEELIIDYDSLLNNGSLPNCDHVFICLGTTIKIAKSKKNFIKVDLEYALAVATKAYKSGAKKLTLISSVGADSNSKNFYLRVKGELEDAILELGFDEHFLRMWEFYLSYCEGGFKSRNINLIQFSMSNRYSS